MLYTHVIIEILIDHYFYKIRIRPKVYDMLGHVLVLFLEICKLFLHDIESGVDNYRLYLCLRRSSYLFT